MRGVSPRFDSLGLSTDLMVLALSGSRIEEAGDFVAVRTPENPTYCWGNFMVLPDCRAVDGAAVAQFELLFPGVSHVAFAFAGTDGEPGAEATCGAFGLDVQRVSILQAASLRPPLRPNLEADYRLLDVADDAQWEQVLALQMAEPGRLGASGHTFMQHRVASYRAIQQGGHGGWFGAFLGGKLVASLGVFTDGGELGRYQAVDTHPRYRRRGLAGSLVCHAGTHALAAFGVKTLVIAAVAEGPSINVYRSVGFAVVETQTGAARRRQSDGSTPI